MSVSYDITPYEPYSESAERSVDLRIDPVEYEQKLLERWPLATKFASFTDNPVCYHLNRRSADGIRWSGEEIQLRSDLQTVTTRGAPSPEFVQWHRAFVSAQYRLYLSCDADGESDEILPDATLAEIADILGVDSIGDPHMIFHIATQAEWRANIAQRLEKSDAWRTYRSAEIAAHGFAQCAGAQQVRRLANALHRGQHGLVLMWLHVEQVTAPIEYAELPGVSAPGETFPRIVGPLDGMAIGRVAPYEPGPDGIFPWPVDIVEMP